MLSKLSLVLLLILLAPSTCLRADDFIPTDSDTRELKLMLAVNTHLMTFSNELEQSEKLHPLTDAELEKKLQATAEKILNAYDPLKKHPTRMARAIQTLKGINWKAFVTFIRHHVHKLKRIFQKDGLVVTTGLIVGAVLEFVVPVILVKSGLAFLLPASAVFPYEPMMLTASYMAKKQWMELQFQKIYGGRKNYLEAKRGFESIRRDLRLGPANDILYPIWKNGESDHAVVISSPTVFRRMTEKMGLAHKRVNFANLVRFLSDRGIKDSFVDAIMDDTSIDPQLKALLLVRFIEQHPDTNLQDEFKKIFVESISSPTALTLPSELKEFVTRFAQINTIEEGLSTLRDLPKNLPANIVARFVEQIAVPSMTENVSDIRARQISTLQKWSHGLIVKAKTTPSLNWGEIWSEPDLPAPKEPNALVAGCKSLFTKMHFSR